MKKTTSNHDVDDRSSGRQFRNMPDAVFKTTNNWELEILRLPDSVRSKTTCYSGKNELRLVCSFELSTNSEFHVGALFFRSSQSWMHWSRRSEISEFPVVLNVAQRCCPTSCTIEPGSWAVESFICSYLLFCRCCKDVWHLYILHLQIKAGEKSWYSLSPVVTSTTTAYLTTW